MVEFAMNSATSGTTRYAPFELNYGYTPAIGITEVEHSPFRGVRAFAQKARWNLMAAHDAIIDHRVRQTHYVNKTCREDPPYAVNDLVYLSTKNLNFPKGRARKLIPRFMGPYKILEVHPESSNIVLELPNNLIKRRIHPMFHMSLVRPHEPNDEEKFPKRDTQVIYDMGQTDDVEWHVDEIIGHQWTTTGDLELRVQWTLGDITWEPLQNCNELQALDAYLELHSANALKDLPRRSPQYTMA